MPAKLGIVAGGGTLPAHLIAACREEGRDFFVLALEDQTQPDKLPLEPHAWIRMGNAGVGIQILRDAGVEDIVLAGPVRRPRLSDLRPDGWTAKLAAKLGWSFLGDDSLLKTLVHAIEGEGFNVVAAESLLGGLLACERQYGAVKPDERARKDISRGLEVVRELGALDIGQAAIVQDGYVLGVEAAEGTDALIARCATLGREGPGGVLVKASKPGQERRVDLPTIGARTIELAAKSRLRGVAVECGGALILDEAEVTAAADRAGIFVVGVKNET